MGLKITLMNGEVIEVDIDDYLSMDFTTIEGKATCQDILNCKDSVKKWVSTDLAESEDTLKFFDKDEKVIDTSLEEFEEDIYKQILKDEDLL